MNAPQQGTSTASAIAAALVVLICAGATMAGHQLSSEVQGAITYLLTVAISFKTHGGGALPSLAEIKASVLADLKTAGAAAAPAAAPAAAVLLAIGLSACAGAADQAVADKAKADAAVAAPGTQTGIALACAGFQIADLGFREIAVPALKVDAAGQDIEAKAMAQIGNVCTPPYPQSTDDVLKKIADATAMLLQAKSAAHAAAGPATGPVASPQ